MERKRKSRTAEPNEGDDEVEELKLARHCSRTHGLYSVYSTLARKVDDAGDQTFRV